LKYKIIILLSITLTACSSAPTVRSFGNNQYLSTGEAEFDVNGMMNEVHKVAEETCKNQGKQMTVIDHRSSHGGTGFAGSKRMYALQFRCS